MKFPGRKALSQGVGAALLVGVVGMAYLVVATHSPLLRVRSSLSIHGLSLGQPTPEGIPERSWQFCAPSKAFVYSDFHRVLGICGRDVSDQRLGSPTFVLPVDSDQSGFLSIWRAGPREAVLSQESRGELSHFTLRAGPEIPNLVGHGSYLEKAHSLRIINR